jgi:cytosine/adenosine deaminase-related metal-dependent hydrolase
MKLDLDGHVVLPGLINSHDHLEFNLFPRLGRGVYPNATEWARDIYHPERSPIREQLQVPKPVRLAWGGLKNLLSGVTTVCHHNPYERKIFGAGFQCELCAGLRGHIRLRSSPTWPHACERGAGMSRS